jgi:hypothetical protein
VEEIESSGVIDSKRKNSDDNVDDVGRVVVKSRRGRKRDCKGGGRLLCVFVQAVFPEPQVLSSLLIFRQDCEK